MSFTASARIVSSIPGRLRIRDCSLKNPGQFEKLGTALASLNHSCSFRANPAAGSLILFYDARQCAMEEMEDAVARMVNAAPSDSNVSNDSAAPDASAVVSASGKRRILLRRANRYSKYVMYASLGISLALAARGARRGHALAGAVFVAALGVHLAVHRKHLLS